MMDRFFRIHNYLRISLTNQCNLKCVYCRPSQKKNIPSAFLSSNEIIQLSKMFVSWGVYKIRLTGGEPTIHKHFYYILEELQSLRPRLSQIAMTTNGTMIHTKINSLKKIGLDSINISLDTLCKSKYEKLTGFDRINRVRATIDQSLYHQLPTKINVVLMKGVNDDEVYDFLELTRHDPIQVQFIEFMPFDNNHWTLDRLVSKNELLSNIRSRYSYKEIPTNPHSTSKVYQIKDYKGKFGIIASMTNPFCHGCNRLRLLSNGEFRYCLFQKGHLNLRECLQRGLSDDQILKLVLHQLQLKKKKHDGMDLLRVTKNSEMIEIGG